MKRLAGGAAVAAGLVVAGVLVAGGDEAPRAQEPHDAGARDRRRSSGATWSTARRSPARSATPTPARWPPASPGR